VEHCFHHQKLVQYNFKLKLKLKERVTPFMTNGNRLGKSGNGLLNASVRSDMAMDIDGIISFSKDKLVAKIVSLAILIMDNVRYANVSLNKTGEH